MAMRADGERSPAGGERGVGGRYATAAVWGGWLVGLVGVGGMI